MKPMSHQPTFLVIGAAKSGTTSLHYFMEQHPEICVPPCKETYIFTRESMEGTWPEVIFYGEDEYRRLFDQHTTEKTRAWGEVTTSNLYYHQEAVPKIRKILGDVQIIILIRNPVDRAYSNWTFTFAYHSERLPFERAIEEEEARKAQKVQFMGHYLSIGFYFEAVRNYLENFGRHQVWLLEDLKERAPETLKSIYGFVGADDSFTPEVQTAYNPSGLPRSRLVQRLLFTDRGTRGSWVQHLMRSVMGRDRADRTFHSLRNLNLKRVPMPAETRRRLIGYYREDILKLQDLIDRDLSHWLNA
jgi:hypothetical protein